MRLQCLISPASGRARRDAAAHAQFKRARIALPITQSLSSSDRNAQLLGEVLDALAVGRLRERVGQVGAPVAAPRAERIEAALQMLGHVAERIGLLREVRRRRHLDRHVRIFGELDHLVDGRRRCAAPCAISAVRLMWSTIIGSPGWRSAIGANFGMLSGAKNIIGSSPFRRPDRTSRRAAGQQRRLLALKVSRMPTSCRAAPAISAAARPISDFSGMRPITAKRFG